MFARNLSIFHKFDHISLELTCKYNVTFMMQSKSMQTINLSGPVVSSYFIFTVKGRVPLCRTTVTKLNIHDGKSSSLNGFPQESEEGRLPLSGLRASLFLA